VAVIVVNQIRPHPGKAQELVAAAKEVKQLNAKYGLTSRLFQSLLAGPNAGTYSFVTEAADLATWAAAFQKVTADPAWPPLLERSFGANGAGTLLSVAQATEVPL
jgi:hypothetical protein